MSLVGGNDYTALIEDSRQAIKRSRDALKISRKQIADAIRLNKDNAALVAFLTEESARLETVSDAHDDLGINIEKLWAIGAAQKLERSKKDKQNDD